MANEKIPGLTETKFKIGNMVCEGCAEKITGMLTSVAGVTDVQSKPFQKRIHVYHYAEQITQDELKNILEKEGFNVIEI